MDVTKIRQSFPVLSQMSYGKPLAYLDNAATTQKPNSVIKTLNKFYEAEYATIHRGIYELSQKSTERFEQVRTQVQEFIGAGDRSEIIFVRNTTEAINLVVSSYGRSFFKAGQEIIVSEVEHHANFVPWQQLAKEMDLKFILAPVNDKGELIFEKFKALLSPNTVMVAIAHISNVLGTVHPIKRVIDAAHRVGAAVLIDGAQAAPHIPVDVQALDCDFYCFSGHKVYGPTGIGVLYGKHDLLDGMTPYQMGGEMIEIVRPEKTTFAKPPAKFEAGTPAIAEVLGLGAALSYIESIGLEEIVAYEDTLLKDATQKLLEIPELRIIGEAKDKASVISFLLGDIHPHDIGTILDTEGIAIRAGHHCSQPTMQRYGIAATARASFSFYNTLEEVDRLVAALHKVREMFK